MAKPLSTRTTSIAGSATAEVLDKAHALKRQGIDLIDLGDGDPDFDTPAHIQRAAKKAMSSGFTHYVSSAGIPELRAAIAHKLRADNGVEVDPDSGVIVTPGGKLAVFASMLALLNEGDEVIIPEPAWVSYRPIVGLAGGITVPLNLTAGNRFSFTAEELNALITPRTKAILLNSPCNPTGKVLTRGELETIAAAATANDLYVISDEVYETIVFDGRKHISIASLPDMAERTLIVNGHSKAFAMTGWRLGYLAGPADLVREIAKIQQHSTAGIAGQQQLETEAREAAEGFMPGDLGPAALPERPMRDRGQCSHLKPGLGQAVAVDPPHSHGLDRERAGKARAARARTARPGLDIARDLQGAMVDPP